MAVTKEQIDKKALALTFILENVEACLVSTSILDPDSDITVQHIHCSLFNIHCSLSTSILVPDTDVTVNIHMSYT